MKKLSEEQIEDLYTFTRKHFVEWYDLQTELVDHLANDIENVWKEHPNFSYKNARDRAFKKFGVFGFMDVIAQRQNTMSKRYTKYLFSALKKWFELPQLFFTIVLFLVFFISFSSSISDYLLFAYYLIVGTWCIYKSIRLKRKFKSRKQGSNKKWLLEEMIFKQAGFFCLIFISQLYNVYNLANSLFGNKYIIILASFVATLFCIINFISFEVLPNKAEKLLMKTYPEYLL